MGRGQANQPGASIRTPAGSSRAQQMIDGFAEGQRVRHEKEQWFRGKQIKEISLSGTAVYIDFEDGTSATFSPELEQGNRFDPTSDYPVVEVEIEEDSA